jgi:AraC-like DNA-binding protein
LEKLDLHPVRVELGELELQEEQLSSQQTDELQKALAAVGFELINNRKGRIIEKIKNTAITLIHHTQEQPREKYSELIANALHLDYPYLSKLFSEIEGITIEQYILQQKTEKIKEYLVYDELNLNEIADRMGYSSVAHLSAQFKKTTGLPPSHFKKIKTNQRKPLDDLSAE